MKPKPLVALNHLQVPWVLAAILIVDGGDVWESDS